jgi:predicted RNA-binding Zn-ribbon protein involved in translation (DUF1610 family)
MKPGFATKLRQCPKCGGTFVHRSRKRNFVERILCRFLLLAPYRCDDCYSRYFSAFPVNKTQ